MNLLGLLYLLVAHYLSGKGVLKLFKVDMLPVYNTCLCMITGVALVSFVPCIVQLLNIPITAVSVFSAVGIFTCVLCIPLFLKFQRPRFIKITLPATYEWPFIVVVALLIFVSVWRCFYFPPVPLDMLTGPELIAEYTVREQTMLNSVFTIDLHTTNNIFKSPYITSLQIVYKLLVCPFGQLWLSVLFVSFTVWLYAMIRRSLHPLLAGLIMLFFLAIPELYAYTYLILYDYSNMIYFFLGFYFLARYMENKRNSEFVFSAFLFGLATYIRTETLVLVGLVVPYLSIYFWKSHYGFMQALFKTCIFLVIPILSFFLCVDVFIKNFIPIPFDTAGQVNHNLRNVDVFFQRFMDMNSKLIFSDIGISGYGYFIFIFCGILFADLVWLRKFKRNSRIALYGILIVYIGLPLLGYLFPLADLFNTTKRGLFKIFPLMLFYMCNSALLLRFSDYLSAKTKT